MVPWSPVIPVIGVGSDSAGDTEDAFGDELGRVASEGPSSPLK